MRAVTVCDLYSLDRDDFDTILQKFPKMKRTMHDAAEERLAQLRDTYGPGWMQNEQSQTNINQSAYHSALLLQQSTLDYLHVVESGETVTQSGSYRSSGAAAAATVVGEQQSRPVESGTSVVSLQVASGPQLPSGLSVPTDSPEFTKPEKVV